MSMPESACPTCDGQPSFSRITDPEMKLVMKTAVDAVHELLCLKSEHPGDHEAHIKFGDLYTYRWDEPSPIGDSMGTHGRTPIRPV